MIAELRYWQLDQGKSSGIIDLTFFPRSEATSTGKVVPGAQDSDRLSYIVLIPRGNGYTGKV